MVGLLLHAKADVHAKSDDGLTVLARAKSLGYTEIIEQLEAAGARDEL
jgi:hypothetical protein